MKAQFKRADASGARVRADLRRRRTRARPGRDQARCASPVGAAAAAAGRRGRRGPPSCELHSRPPHNRAFDRNPHGHASRPRRTRTARPAQALLEPVRQPHHLAADPRPRRLRRLQRLAVVAARRRRRRPSAMYDELERAAQAERCRQGGARLRRPEGSLRRHRLRRSRAACSRPRSQFEQGKTDDARGQPGPGWPTTPAEPEYRSIARLRLAALLLEQKQYDEALEQLDAANARTFEPLVADRRGDVLLAQGKKDAARAAYQQAYAAMDPARRLPAPGRSQADRARRRAGVGRGLRRRERRRAK